jgi:hypothetical protein
VFPFHEGENFATFDEKGLQNIPAKNALNEKKKNP